MRPIVIVKSTVTAWLVAFAPFLFFLTATTFSIPPSVPSRANTPFSVQQTAHNCFSTSFSRNCLVRNKNVSTFSQCVDNIENKEPLKFSVVDRRMLFTRSIFIASVVLNSRGQSAVAYSGPQIDVNNAMAREYTAFPGLYPTIATKIVNGAKDEPYKSKAEVYAALENDLQRDRLREYDAAIVVNKPDAALKQFKASQICKYECGSRVSSSYRDEQIRGVQADRR